MNNNNSKILNIVLIILLVLSLGYIACDKLLSNDTKKLPENQTEKENDSLSNDEQNINSSNYSLKDFYGSVFQIISSPEEAYLTLWSDETYIYTYTKNSIKSGYLGKYQLKGENIQLNHIFEIDYGISLNSSADDKAKLISENSNVSILKINDINQLTDETENIKLNRVNQPANPGGDDFYSILHNLLD